MKIVELTDEVVGKRIRVTRVAPSEAERLGHCNDTARLTGQTGTVTRLGGAGRAWAQLVVAWDDPSCGSLMLADDDEVEIL